MTRRSEQLGLFDEPGGADEWPAWPSRSKWQRKRRLGPRRQGAGLLLVARDTGRVLLGLRAGWLRDGCTWSTPGGLVDAREEPVVAALRELWEELGINLLMYSSELKHTHVAEHEGRRYTTFVVEVEEELPALADEHETLEAGWFGLAELHEEELHPGLRAMLEGLGLIEPLAR